MRMSDEKQAVLDFVRERPDCEDGMVHREAYRGRPVRGPHYTESTVKHLLALERAGLVRSEGSARKRPYRRTWYPVGDGDAA